METKHGSDMGYRTHSVVDGGKARIILATLVTPFEVTDNQPMLDLHRLARFRKELHYFAAHSTKRSRRYRARARDFSLRSPLNALVLTLAMFILTIVSALVAIFQLKDTKVALSLATLFLWLIVALTAATFQALWNADDFYKVGPFVEPRARLVKKQA